MFLNFKNWFAVATKTLGGMKASFRIHAPCVLPPVIVWAVRYIIDDIVYYKTRAWLLYKTKDFVNAFVN